jgi:hypothetical protein
MFYQGNDLAVAQIPKAGLRSIGRWLYGFQVVPNDRVSASRRVAFIRHPIERLKSCYSMMRDMQDQGVPHACGAPVDSWESFVDHVLDGAKDEHWMPQTWHCGDVPNDWRRFEDLPACCDEFHPGPLPHLNKVTRRPTSNYRETELREMYAADFAHWVN